MDAPNSCYVGFNPAIARKALFVPARPARARSTVSAVRHCANSSSDGAIHAIADSTETAFGGGKARLGHTERRTEARFARVTDRSQPAVARAAPGERSS